MNSLIKDTSIIFELVLIGFQVLIWVSLLVLTIFGYHWLNLEGLKEWSAELSVALVGVAYMFGLIFDKAVGALPYSWIIGGSTLTRTDESPSILEMRMNILTKKPEIFDALERRINQHRLVRSTVFNLALISLAALAFLMTQLGFSIRLFIVFLLLSALFVGLSLFTGRRSAETLYLELFQVYKAINESMPDDEGEGDKQSPSEERHVRAV
ncbi:MAG TPA: hypothetical protein VGC66_16280 [Pyrinomonadaceae bacterium]|jgi:hypothetical protein